MTIKLAVTSLIKPCTSEMCPFIRKNPLFLICTWAWSSSVGVCVHICMHVWLLKERDREINESFI